MKSAFRRVSLMSSQMSGEIKHDMHVLAAWMLLLRHQRGKKKKKKKKTDKFILRNNRHVL